MRPQLAPPISFGSRVLVCDNLAFVGEHVIRRKHTANAKRYLPGLVAEVVEPLRNQRLQQAAQFAKYRSLRLSKEQVRHAIIKLYKRGVINLTRIADVLDAYNNPPLDWGPPSASRLNNAVTFSLTGKVSEDPSITGRLNNTIGWLCNPTRQLEFMDQLQALSWPSYLCSDEWRTTTSHDTDQAEAGDHQSPRGGLRNRYRCYRTGSGLKQPSPRICIQKTIEGRSCAKDIREIYEEVIGTKSVDTVLSSTHQKRITIKGV